MIANSSKHSQIHNLKNMRKMLIKNMLCDVQTFQNELMSIKIFEIKYFKDTFFNLLLKI